MRDIPQLLERCVLVVLNNKSDGKRKFGKHRHLWEGNIKNNLKNALRKDQKLIFL